MSKTKKHAAPLRCRLEVWLRGPSPSCSIYCRIGSRGTKRPKCRGCKENNREAICDGISMAFAKSVEAAAKMTREAAQK